MGRRQAWSELVGQRVGLSNIKFEDAAEFFLPLATLETGQMLHRDVRREAGAQDPKLQPQSVVDQFCEVLPIDLIAEVRRLRLGPCDDHGVELRPFDCLSGTGPLVPPGPGGRAALQRGQMQTHKLEGRAFKAFGHEGRKLPVGVDQRRIGHVIHKPDLQDLVRRARHQIALANGRDDGATAVSAWSRSARISSMCSIPTLRRIISGFTPAARRTSGGICRWVVDAG